MQKHHQVPIVVVEIINKFARLNSAIEYEMALRLIEEDKEGDAMAEGKGRNRGYNGKRTLKDDFRNGKKD